LSHDFYTDIITFNLSDSEEIKGEIYISVDRIRENAKLFNTSINTELLRIIFHGVLHLCGYNDKSKVETKIMNSKEEFYLNKWKKSL
jgi:rRNA maturation RNase YbeY